MIESSVLRTPQKTGSMNYQTCSIVPHANLHYFSHCIYKCNNLLKCTDTF